MSKPMTVAEKRYVSECVRAGCVLCRHLRLGETPCEWHHGRAGQGRMRAPHTWGAGLCVPHHRGDEGIHMLGGERFVEAYGISETELIEMTRQEFRSFLPVSERYA